MQSISPVGVTGTNEQPTIIIKKVRPVVVRHNGSWKVAFADFVTALMALFMVMWLMGTEDGKQQAIAGYFQDPTAFQQAVKEGGQAVSGQLEGIAHNIEQALLDAPEWENLKKQVSIEVGRDGLRIELLESDEGTFFASGSPSLSSFGSETLGLIGAQLGNLPNKIIIEGHTDSRPFNGRRNYSNWELSVDRANQARRLLAENGVDPQRIVEVRGFADVRLRNEDDPEDASNRRISLIVKYKDR